MNREELKKLYNPDYEHPDFPGLSNPEFDPFFADINIPEFRKKDKQLSM